MEFSKRARPSSVDIGSASEAMAEYLTRYSTSPGVHGLVFPTFIFLHEVVVDNNRTNTSATIQTFPLLARRRTEFYSLLFVVCAPRLCSGLDIHIQILPSRSKFATRCKLLRRARHVSPMNIKFEKLAENGESVMENSGLIRKRILRFVVSLSLS